MREKPGYRLIVVGIVIEYGGFCYRICIRVCIFAVFCSYSAYPRPLQNTVGYASDTHPDMVYPKFRPTHVSDTHMIWLLVIQYYPKFWICVDMTRI